jgi:hypothetical protein
MHIKITKKNHMLYGRTYEVVEEEKHHYIIRLSYNNALVRIFKIDAEIVNQ